MSRLESLLIVNGRVVTPGEVLEADILVKDGRIASVAAPGEISGAGRIVDAAGCYVLPGVVDAHTHIMLSTGIYKTVDTWEEGTRAAACGGVTTVIDFANQIVGKPFMEALEARRAEAADATIDYSFHMVILDADREADELRTHLEHLMALGVPSIKLFTTYRPNYYVDDATILRIFRAMPPGMIAMVHCENDSIVTEATRRLVERGETAWRYHGTARPKRPRRRRCVGSHTWQGWPRPEPTSSIIPLRWQPAKYTLPGKPGIRFTARPAPNICCWMTQPIREITRSISSYNRLYAAGAMQSSWPGS